MIPVASLSPPSMNPRPRAVTVIGWLYLAAGLVGFSYHFTSLNPTDPFANDAVWILSVRLLAVVAGAFLLRGHNWARWLVLAWMAWHVYLGARHELASLVMHGLLLAVLAWFLFRPNARTYFRPAATPVGPPA